MEDKKKEWIKDNCVSIIFYIFPLFVYIIAIFMMLDCYNYGLSNDDMLSNIFIAITVYGSLTVFTLAYILILIWRKGMIKFIDDYRKFIGE